jgi:hypothetical protein
MGIKKSLPETEKKLKQKLEAANYNSLTTDLEMELHKIYFNENKITNPRDINRLEFQCAHRKLENIIDCQKNGRPEQLNSRWDTKYTFVADLSREQNCLFIGCESKALKVLHEADDKWLIVVCEQHYSLIKNMVESLGASLWSKLL